MIQRIFFRVYTYSNCYMNLSWSFRNATTSSSVYSWCLLVLVRALQVSKNSLWTAISQAAIFFGQNFASCQQKKRGCNWCKGVFWENMDPCCYIQTIGFGMSPTCSKIPKLFYFALTCRQIWLSPLLDGSQPTYVTKLKIKNTSASRHQDWVFILLLGMW
jgi:hypothetical protein